MPSATYGELIRGNPVFRRLWFSQLISESGSWISFVAELGIVRTLSGSPLSVTILLLAKLLPFFIAAPLAGVVTDSRSRKHIMIFADLARAVAALGYLAANTPDRVWVVYVCAGVISSGTVFFEAARSAVLPNVVTGRELLTANVTMGSTRFLLASVGAGLGAAVATRFDYNTAFTLNSASFVASAVLILLIPASQALFGKTLNREMLAGVKSSLTARVSGRGLVPVEGVLPARIYQLRARAGTRKMKSAFRGFLADLREGTVYIWSTPFVRALILINITWATGGGLVSILFDRIGGLVYRPASGDWGVSALFGAAGVGLFFGTLCARRAVEWACDSRRAGNLLGWALLAHGLCLAVGGLMPSLVWVVALVAVSRFLMGIEIGMHETMMMRVLADQYRGRVFSADRAMEILMMSLSAVAGGWSLTVLSPLSLMIISGLLSASPGLIWLLALRFTNFRVPEHAIR